MREQQPRRRPSRKPHLSLIPKSSCALPSSPHLLTPTPLCARFLEISAREEKASQTLRQLQKEIKLEKADRERQVTTRNETIQKLR